MKISLDTTATAALLKIVASESPVMKIDATLISRIHIVGTLPLPQSIGLRPTTGYWTVDRVGHHCHCRTSQDRRIRISRDEDRCDTHISYSYRWHPATAASECPRLSAVTDREHIQTINESSVILCNCSLGYCCWESVHPLLRLIDLNDSQ